MYAVLGMPAEFDPCNASVELKTPNEAIKSPLVIISHVGAGLGDAERKIAYEFRKLGLPHWFLMPIRSMAITKSGNFGRLRSPTNPDNV
jgi:hypothetical protein